MTGAALHRRVVFTAAHRYHRPEWTDERNREVFGDCATQHTHEYRCDVTVAGPIDRLTGMIVDLATLDRVLDEQIVRPLDGRLVNDAVPEFRPGGMIPTCEVLATLLAARVQAGLKEAGSDARVAEVRVAEDDTLSASWTSTA